MKKQKLTKKDLQNWLKQRLPKTKVEVIEIKKIKQKKSKFIQLQIPFKP